MDTLTLHQQVKRPWQLLNGQALDEGSKLPPARKNEASQELEAAMASNTLMASDA